MSSILAKGTFLLENSVLLVVPSLPMTKRAKRVKKLFTNSKTVSFQEIDTVLQGLGFKRRQPRSGSSHYFYSKGLKGIVIPFKKPHVKEIYVKQVLELIEEDL